MKEAITVYGTQHCGACMMFKQKLHAAKLDFQYTNDPDQLASAADKSGLVSAPIVKIGATYYMAQDACKYLGI